MKNEELQDQDKEKKIENQKPLLSREDKKEIILEVTQGSVLIINKLQELRRDVNHLNEKDDNSQCFIETIGREIDEIIEEAKKLGRVNDKLGKIRTKNF